MSNHTLVFVRELVFILSDVVPVGMFVGHFSIYTEIKVTDRNCRLIRTDSPFSFDLRKTVPNGEYLIMRVSTIVAAERRLSHGRRECGHESRT